MERKISISLFVLLFIFINTAFAQSKYGNATIEELEMTSYPQDTSAIALILLKNGETHFVFNDQKGFQFEYTLQMKIKILKKEGLDFCDQQISFYEESSDWKESVRGLSGTTYNLENGKVVKTKLSKEFIFDGDVNERWKLKKFTMPAAKVGSVIEFKYTITSDFFWELRDFAFQSSVPIQYAKYEVRIPEYYHYNMNMGGYLRVQTKDEPVNDQIFLGGQIFSFTARQLTFTIQDAPALKDEKYLWCKNDYLTKVSFELRSTQYPGQMVKTFTSSWGKIDEQILKSSYNSNVKKTGLFKDNITKTDNDFQNAAEILSMIKYKVKWNDKYNALPGNIGDALKNGLGSSADMNFLLINALKAAGLDAYPVILSTRSNGRIPFTHPSLSAFNYVITGVTIDSKKYFTDAAAKYGNWNMLPERCMVPQARIMKEGACEWVNLSTISSGTTLIITKSKFVDDKCKMDITWTRKGNNAYDFRSFFFERHKDQEDYVSNLATNLNGEISDFKIENEMDINKDVKTEFTLTKDMPLGDDHVYINPLQIKLFSENPFTAEERTFPINFDHLENYIQIVDIEIPEGYTVEELPKAEKYIFGEDTPISFTYNISHQGNIIKLHYQYQLKKLLLLQDEYVALKDFFAKVILKNSEQIVLKKVSEADVAVVTE